MRQGIKGIRGLCLFLGAILVMAPTAVRAEVTVGEPAPDFTLTDTAGTEHSLSDFEGKYVVLEWINFDCPFVVKHYSTNNMQDLQAKYTGQDVVWLTINSSAPGKQGAYSAEDVQRMMEEKGMASTAYLMDSSGDVGRLYGAKTTPHMYVVNPEGELIYQGAIDDAPTADPGDVEGSLNYVDQALTEAMSGQDVSIPATRAYGCAVKY